MRKFQQHAERLAPPPTNLMTMQGMEAYTPGNGTKYLLVWMPLTSDMAVMAGASDRAPASLVSWLNPMDAKPRAIVVTEGDYFHWPYIASKLGATEGDARALCARFATVMAGTTNAEDEE